MYTCAVCIKCENLFKKQLFRFNFINIIQLIQLKKIDCEYKKVLLLKENLKTLLLKF